MNSEVPFVVKIGGGEGNAFQPAVIDLARLWSSGSRWVLLHGGSARTNEVSEALGHPPEFVTSPSGFTSRKTDRKTAEIFSMVYAGEMNTRIVERFQQSGINALGLSGLDGGLLRGKRKKAIRIRQNGRTRILRNNYTGKIELVNSGLLKTLLRLGYAPVLSPPALSEEEEIINIDGDRAAAAVAGSLCADSLILLTGAPGVLEDSDNEQSVIPHIYADDVQQVIEESARGRMGIKLHAAAEALESGVSEVIIAPSDCEDPVTGALNGNGTKITKRKEYENVSHEV